jgi:tRNA threonylcarbamoyladenosine biosynthesis protein TsaE
MPIQTPFKIQFISNSVEETQSLGIKIGQNIHIATVITLFGDLGSGKTAFVQGLAKGLDVPEDYYITSPTYTLLNEYPGRFPLHHFDFYRLEDIADIYSTGFYEKLDTNGIIAVEWAERLSQDLNRDHVNMEFVIRDDDSRIINITAVGLEPIQLVKKIQDKNN